MTAETPAPIDPELLLKAKKRVALRMGFFTHALVYAVVNGGLFVLN
ncbi:MAG: 2TM domain-containing protein, partial [Phenylobacterium sp.]|nr:2TM domain-containing protein [Phenylobacterium sp.]